MGYDLTKNNRQNLMKLAEEGKIVPTELAIETVFGCNAKCTMCFIDAPTARKKRVMKMDLYESIVDQMSPFADQINKFDLWCLGEPTIDKWLPQRIEYAKKKNFKRTAIATNGEALNENLSKDLLDSGIDTIIASIDATNKETHAKIRVGLNYEKVVKNFENIVRLRDKNNYKTRFIFRFVLQDLNRHQYEDFKSYWSKILNPEKNDDIYSYKEHNWGGYMGNKKIMLGNQYDEFIEKKPCHYVFESMCILADGNLALCPADFLEGQFALGNVKEVSPMEAFNSLAYKKLRKLNLEENKNNVDLCKSCTILYSNANRGWTWNKDDNKGSLDRSSAESYMKV